MTERSPIYGALAYLKPNGKEELLDEQGEIMTLSEEDSVTELPFNEDLIVNFLHQDEEMELFRFVQNRDLQEHGLTKAELLQIGLDNLLDRTESHELQLQQLECGYHVLLLDGNFEASLILLDDLWDGTLNEYVKTGYAVAIPARDVLMFCDVQDADAIAEMRAVVERIWQHGDHLLTKQILTRRDGKWVGI